MYALKEDFNALKAENTYTMVNTQNDLQVHPSSLFLALISPLMLSSSAEPCHQALNLMLLLGLFVQTCLLAYLSNI